MFGALNTGLSGLRANLKYLEVVGNNLSNSATTGYKGDRVTFKDVFYQTFRRPTGPNGNLGGINGLQIGQGSTLASVDTIHTQGSIVGTGRPFDLALDGGGYFVVNDGTRDFYTRAGTFGVDANNNLVDTRTGFRVKNVGGSAISVSAALSVPAKATENAIFGGNLPAVSSGPFAEVQESSYAFNDFKAATVTGATNVGASTNLNGETLQITVDRRAPVTITFPSSATGLTAAQVVSEINNAFSAANVPATASLNGSSLVIESNTKGNRSLLSIDGGTAATIFGFPSTQSHGSEAVASATTALNDLDYNKTDYQAGDIIQMTGLDSTGQAVNISFVYGTDGTTLGDLVTKLNASGAYANTTATLTTDGKIKFESTVKGKNDMTLAFSDSSAAVGETDWTRYAFKTTVEGADKERRSTSRTVFDSLGTEHTLSGVFERQDDGTWNLELSIPASEGSVAGSPITGITFGSDGKIQAPTSASIDLTFTGGAAAQTIALDLTGAAGGGGLTQFDGAMTAKVLDQDGYRSGELASYEVTGSGEIVGKYSNGVDLTIDQIAVATFQNEDGLAKEGATLFSETTNSGSALIDTAGAGGAGTIAAGSLENSNVDTAEEFVRLIEAQRAFQGNARVITKSDEMLAELSQIVS